VGTTVTQAPSSPPLISLEESTLMLKTRHI
jgi:hypothetical protein